MSKELPPRIWVNLYRNYLDNDKYKYHAHETEEGSFEFRRLANYSRTETYLSTKEHLDILRRERAKAFEEAAALPRPFSMESFRSLLKQKAREVLGECRHGKSLADRCFECDSNTGVESRK